MPDDLLTDLGIDLDAPEVRAARADAAELGNLIESLVSLRSELGLRQRDLARIIGTTQSAVSDFERIGGDPRLTTVQRYARALGACVRLSVDDSRCDEGPWRHFELESGRPGWHPPKGERTWKVAEMDFSLAA